MSRKEHEEYQGKLCFICLGKCNFSPISQKHRDLIFKYVYPEVYRDETWLPRSLCAGCTRKLTSQESKSPRKFSEFPDYAMLARNVRDQTRLQSLRVGSDKPCDCELCKRGSVSKTSNLINQSVAMTSSIFSGEKQKPGRPSDHPKGTKCIFCHEIDIPSSNHDCDAERILGSLSMKTCEMVASETIKQIMIESNSKEVTLKSKKGRPLQVICKNCDHLIEGGASALPSKVTIPSSTLMKIRSQLNLSAKKIGDAGKLLAQDMGMKLEPYFDKLLVKKGHELDEFFDVTTVQFEAMEVDENTGKKVKCQSEKTLVYCKDVEALVLYIKEKRGFAPDDENIFFKIGLDSGRSFLKICMTMQQMPSQKNDSDSDSDTMIEVEKPNKNKFKDSGVKKLIILGLVQNGMETYNNVKILMDMLGVNTLSFSKSVSVDLKMVNLLIGIGPHSSKYPCGWCFGTAPFKEKAALRTLGELKKLSGQFATEFDGDKKYAKDCFNCLHTPVLDGPDSTLILEACPIDELHVILGVTNHINDSANTCVGDNSIYDWELEHSIVKKNYKGNELNGPNCYKLLKLSREFTDQLPAEHKNFGLALQKLYEVVSDCFGMHLNELRYLKSIEDFETIYRQLPHAKDPEKHLSVTIKAHCIFQHIPETIELTGMSLGIFSTQAFESVHYDFLETWKRFKYPESHEKYPNQLKKATVNYNSYHVSDGL